MKQTKTLKFIFFILILIPIVLFGIGIVQTFVLKAKQNELYKLNQNIETVQQQESLLEDELKYKESDEYLKDYHKYVNGYGNEGDIEIDIK